MVSTLYGISLSVLKRVAPRTKVLTGALKGSSRTKRFRSSLKSVRWQGSDMSRRYLPEGSLSKSPNEESVCSPMSVHSSVTIRASSGHPLLAKSRKSGRIPCKPKGFLEMSRYMILGWNFRAYSSMSAAVLSRELFEMSKDVRLLSPARSSRKPNTGDMPPGPERGAVLATPRWFRCVLSVTPRPSVSKQAESRQFQPSSMDSMFTFETRLATT
mmetsp:Transcript_33804/g.60780  ORF Transcript_33804/g.60780 Transcript_33804/m.60780 type:complete len:214 (+) Transcript_33804:2246-2887(+)